MLNTLYCQRSEAIVNGGIPGSDPFENPEMVIKYTTKLRQNLITKKNYFYLNRELLE